MTSKEEKSSTEERDQGVTPSTSLSQVKLGFIDNNNENVSEGKNRTVSFQDKEIEMVKKTNGKDIEIKNIADPDYLTREHDKMIHQDTSSTEKDHQVIGFEDRREYLLSKGFLATRISLGFLNLISFALKIPLLIFLLRMVAEVLSAKKQEAQVTTIEPPYDEDLVPANPVADESEAKAQRRKLMIETGTLLVIYIGMLLIHVLCAVAFWMNKGIFHVMFYLPVLASWLFFSITSYLVQEWRWPLGFIFFIFKAFFHGNELFGPPDRLELSLIRMSFWFDGVTFLLTIGFLVMTLKLKRHLKQETFRCPPNCNPLRIL